MFQPLVVTCLPRITSTPSQATKTILPDYWAAENGYDNFNNSFANISCTNRFQLFYHYVLFGYPIWLYTRAHFVYRGSAALCHTVYTVYSMYLTIISVHP